MLLHLLEIFVSSLLYLLRRTLQMRKTKRNPVISINRDIGSKITPILGHFLNILLLFRFTYFLENAASRNAHKISIILSKH